MKQAIVDKLIRDSIEFITATIDQDRKMTMTRLIKGNKATMNVLKKSFDKYLERKTEKKDWRMEREKEQLKKMESTMTKAQIRRDKQINEEREAARREDEQRLKELDARDKQIELMKRMIRLAEWDIRLMEKEINLYQRTIAFEKNEIEEMHKKIAQMYGAKP